MAVVPLDHEALDPFSRPLSGRVLDGAGRVRLLELQPDLADGLDEREAALALHALVARAVWVDRGPWAPPVDDDHRFDGWLGVLVLEGLVSRSVAFDRLTAQELVGPGDLLRPWEDDGATASIPPRREWCVLQRTRLALLDERVLALACRWPPVVRALFARTTERSRSLGLHLAIAQARRADVRVLLLFWHLADRWGRVSTEGTVVPVPLTHERIAELVCLRRPTVSMTLRRLAAERALVRRSDGSWLLPRQPPDLRELDRRRDPRAQARRPARPPLP